MWYNTKVSRLLSIQYPIIQGPFGGGFSSEKLLATVSNLGGMGSFGLNAYPASEILEIDKRIKALTSKSYALNLWVPLQKDPIQQFNQGDLSKLKVQFQTYFEDLKIDWPKEVEIKGQNFEHQIEALLEAQPPVASFIFGIPATEIIQALKARQIITMAVATTLEEALEIENKGIEVIIASGMEAGGHRASFLQPAEKSLIPLRKLVRQISKESKLPLIAAGGISNGKDIVEILQLGADAVQLGTAFLATKESNASALHKAKLLSDEIYETRLTKIFTGRLARMIATKFIQENQDSAFIAPFPAQSNFLKPLRKAALQHELADFEAFYAGQGLNKLQYNEAKQLFASLIREVEALVG